MSETETRYPGGCLCGALRYEAQGTPKFTGLCYCTDCRAFARFLERPDVLDAVGGTDIFQIAAGRVKLTAGTDAVRCLSFSSKVLRWYADCCQTTPRRSIGEHSRLPRI